jgi:hypothetical protein
MVALEWLGESTDELQFVQTSLAGAVLGHARGHKSVKSAVAAFQGGLNLKAIEGKCEQVAAVKGLHEDRSLGITKVDPNNV